MMEDTAVDIRICTRRLLELTLAEAVPQADLHFVHGSVASNNADYASLVFLMEDQ